MSTPEAIKVGVSARDAARLLGIAPALAKEELLSAESRGGHKGWVKVLASLCQSSFVIMTRKYQNILSI